MGVGQVFLLIASVLKLICFALLPHLLNHLFVVGGQFLIFYENVEMFLFLILRCFTLSNAFYLALLLALFYALAENLNLRSQARLQKSVVQIVSS